MKYVIHIYPDGDGWYGEVWLTCTGETVHITITFPRKGDAIISARRWVISKRGKVDLIR